MAKGANIVSTEFGEPKTNGSTIESDKSAKVENYDAGKRVKNDKNKEANLNNKRNFRKSCLLSGAFGALVTLSIVVLM